MDAKQAYSTLRARLEEAGLPNAAQEADWLLQHVAGRPRLLLDEVTEEQWRTLQDLARRRARHQPLQYLLGRWSFLGRELLVGPGVLIPRPETEEVCLAALRAIEDQTAPVVVDLCAGSGALALGIQDARPDAKVTAVELDEAAFVWLQKNISAKAAEGGPAPTALRANAETYWQKLPPASLHLLVSNPPYVTAEEYETLEPELRAEPKQALVAGEGGLHFYRLFARHYQKALCPGGHLVLEIGADQGPAVREILENAGWQAVRIRPDLAGHPRIALAQAP